MRDKPSTDELLEAVILYIREELVSSLEGAASFKARVAANALDLARRDRELGSKSDDAEQARLAVLLSKSGSLSDLDDELCRRIREGKIAPNDQALIDHMWATTLTKLTIDQPTYASYRLEAGIDDQF